MQKGCACKFLYGSETEDEKKKLIETALADKTELKLEIKFYKKLGKKNVPYLRNKRDSLVSCVSHLLSPACKLKNFQAFQIYGCFVLLSLLRSVEKCELYRNYAKKPYLRTCV